MAEVIEKALKAELIRTGWSLQRTHDLIELEEEIALRSADLLELVRPLTGSFAQIYFTNRYPGFDMEDGDWPTLRAHLEDVSTLLTTIQNRLQA